MNLKDKISQDVEEIKKALSEGKELNFEQMEILFLAAYLEEENYGCKKD